MKPLLSLTLVVLGVPSLVSCHSTDTRHEYVIERVKDINGNDCFLRIDVTAGDECVIGHGWAVNRLMQGAPPELGYLVPFCNAPEKKKP